MTHQVRDALQDEIPKIAQLWYSGWYDGHAEIVPEALMVHRTLDSFRKRTVMHLDKTRVIGPPNDPVGFTMAQDDELYQMFVSKDARGTGVAAILIADFEARCIEENVPLAWLACTIGNHRAARFYEKCGWKNVGTETHQLETLTKSFPLDVWRFEKQLGIGSATHSTSTI